MEGILTKKEWIRIAKEYRTPLYLFDCGLLKARTEKIRKAIGGDTGLCYAMKANPFLTGEMAEWTDRIEVCSPGEMHICIRKEIDPSRILLSGVNKTKQDIEEAMAYGVRHFTAESRLHMHLLDLVSRERKTSILVYLRLSSGNQFGMDLTDMTEIVKNRENFPFCALRGIHYFAGTQKKMGRHQEKDFQKILSALETLKEQAGFDAEEIEYGPGFYFPYFEEEEPDDLNCVSRLAEVIHGAAGGRKVTVEMGRYFAAECGYYLTSVCDAKTNDGNHFLIIDGGIHHVNYFGGMMGLKVPHLQHIKPFESVDSAAEPENTCICGSLCTTADVIIRSLPLVSPAPGDLLLFENAGAYSCTESSALFLSRDLPKVLMKKDGRLWTVRDAVPTYGLNC